MAHQRTSIAFITLSIVGCSGPSGLPRPPTDLTPPVERAAECPPVKRFAHDWFHMADLRERTSCQNFLEQDECVLAIFEDCTDSNRQWEGQISVDGRVTLMPLFIQTPTRPGPASCTGLLDDSVERRSFVELKCEGGEDELIVLERNDPLAAPFGVLEPEARVAVSPRSSPIRGLLPDFVLLEDRRELWTLNTSPDRPQESGVHIQDLATMRPVPAIAVADARAIALAPNGGTVAVGARRAVHLVDTETQAIVQTATTSREVAHVAFSLNGDVLYLATALPEERFVQQIERRDPTTLARIGDPVRASAFIHRLIALPDPGPGEPALLITGRLGISESAGVLMLFDPSLEMLWAETIGFVPEDARLLEGARRVAMVAPLRNSYWELDWSTRLFDPPIAVPFYAQLRSVAYDAQRDRVFVAGGGTRITTIDRQTRRAVQETVTISSAAYRLALDPTDGRVYALESMLGYVDVVAPVP